LDLQPAIDTDNKAVTTTIVLLNFIGGHLNDGCDDAPETCAAFV
jgi:hypothetical protein